MSRLRRGLLAGVVMVGLSAPAAVAHSGGRAQLYVDSVHLEPQAGGWLAELVLRDADSGKPEPGFGVEVSASGSGPPVGPIALADPDGDGRYAGLVPVTAGSWTLAVEAAEIPGGPRGLPFARSWPATLHAGQALDLGGTDTSGGGRAGGGLPAVPLGLGLAASAALCVGWRRYRTQGFSFSRSSVVEKTPT